MSPLQFPDSRTYGCSLTTRKSSYELLLSCRYAASRLISFILDDAVLLILKIAGQRCYYVEGCPRYFFNLVLVFVDQNVHCCCWDSLIPMSGHFLAHSHVHRAIVIHALSLLCAEKGIFLGLWRPTLKNAEWSAFDRTFGWRGSFVRRRDSRNASYISSVKPRIFKCGLTLPALDFLSTRQGKDGATVRWCQYWLTENRSAPHDSLKLNTLRRLSRYVAVCKKTRGIRWCRLGCPFFQCCWD